MLSFGICIIKIKNLPVETGRLLTREKTAVCLLKKFIQLFHAKIPSLYYVLVITILPLH